MSNKLFKIALYFLVLSPFYVVAQNITGVVTDENNKPLEFASVAVINAKDSLLISSANTDKKGLFTLTQIPQGQHIFQVHLIGYKIHQRLIDFNVQPINIGTITLNNSNQLDEILIEAIIPISNKKDTIAYNTKAFKIRVDDNVEDLLKKLPGIEVDVSGKITAQGEEVTKIYVNHKEFFSGDPAIATKNLSADAIKNIEVIDEKSERSRVSGVNDSQRNKVINLNLKEDKKINDFGKFQGGYGTDDRYLSSLNYNRFSSKLQASIIGKLNNVNTSGSDISEIIAFDSGGGMNRRGRSSGNSGSGFLTTGNTGLNLGYELKKDQNLNSDYVFNNTNLTTGDIYTKQIEYIEGEEILSESNSENDNLSNSHAITINFRNRSNKLSSFYVSARGNTSNNSSNGINTLDKFNGGGELNLKSSGTNKSNSKLNSGNIALNYTKRFKEESKRHFTTRLIVTNSTNTSYSVNNQTTNFNLSNPTETFDSEIETNKDQKLKNLSLNIKGQYTEPIYENHFLEVEGEFSYFTSADEVNQTQYKNNTLQTPLIYQQYDKNNEVIAGLGYKYDNDTLTFSAQAKIINQTQKFGLKNDAETKNGYTYFNPELQLRYRPKRGKFLYVNLQKSINLPRINQLSTVVNDFNPLFISQGNPNLIPEDTYSISAAYVNYNQASGFSMSSRFSFNHTENTIINSETTDELGIRYSSYQNYGVKNNFTIRVNFGNRIKSIGIRYNLFLNGGYSEYSTLINTEVNETKSKDGTIGISIENNKKENIDTSIGITWKKNFTTFSSGNTSNRDYLQQSYYAKLDWKATSRFNINSQLKFDVYSDSNFGDNQKTPIWNASLSYSLLKSKRLNVIVSALDILNKSIGLERTSTNNYYREVNSDVLGNYYMLSLSYSLNGNNNPTANARSFRMGRFRG